MSSEVFKVAVSVPIGPISLTDGSIITDMVRSNLPIIIW